MNRLAVVGAVLVVIAPVAAKSGPPAHRVLPGPDTPNANPNFDFSGVDTAAEIAAGLACSPRVRETMNAP